MSMYYKNSKYDFKISPDMVDLLLNHDVVSKYINNTDINRLTALLPEGIEVKYFYIGSFRIYKKYFKRG
jgi:hypothetical protein